jgi:hypothetical protein
MDRLNLATIIKEDAVDKLEALRRSKLKKKRNGLKKLKSGFDGKEITKKNEDDIQEKKEELITNIKKEDKREKWLKEKTKFRESTEPILLNNEEDEKKIILDQKKLDGKDRKNNIIKEKGYQSDKKETTWKDGLNLFGKWEEEIEKYEPNDPSKILENEDDSSSKNKCSETISEQENWNFPLENKEVILHAPRKLKLSGDNRMGPLTNSTNQLERDTVTKKPTFLNRRFSLINFLRQDMPKQKQMLEWNRSKLENNLVINEKIQERRNDEKSKREKGKPEPILIAEIGRVIKDKKGNKFKERCSCYNMIIFDVEKEKIRALSPENFMIIIQMTLWRT